MSVMLGEAYAKITLDVSGLTGSAGKAAQALRALDGLGKGAFDGLEKSADSVGKRIDALRGMTVDINTSAAEGALTGLGSAAQDTASTIDAMGGMQFDVDASAAIASMEEVRVNAQDAAAAVTAAGGVVFGLNTTEAVAGLTQVRTEAQDAVAAITAASGASFDINTSAAVASLLAISTATQDVEAQLASASSSTLAISVTMDQLNAASRAVQELRQTVGQTMTATVSIGGLGELEAATSEAVRTREAIGGIGDAAPSINLGGLNGDLSQATALASELASNLRGLGSIGLGAGLAGLLIAPLVQGIQTAAQLEQSLKNVEVALGNVSKADLGRLGQSIRDIGSDTQFSAKEIAEVAESLAKAGYDVSDMIDGKMLPAVANLASATGSDLQTAVTGIVQAMATWSPAIVDSSIAMTDASRAADILTVAANSSSADIQDIIAGMRNLGPVVSQMGVGFDEAAAAISIFTNYGLKGADAGISLARGLQNLNQPTSEASKLMQELGISVFDVQGKFVGFEQLFGQLSNAMRGMTDEARFTTISLLFGAEAADAYALAVSMGVDPLVATVNAMQQTGIAADQAAEKTNTLSGAWQRLSEASSTALGSLAGGLVGPLTVLTSVLDGAVGIFGGLPTAVQQAIGGLAGFVGSILAVVTAVNLTRAAMAAMNLSFGSITGVSAAIGALRNLGSALAATRVGMAALAIATGPIGIALAAVGVAAAVIGGIWLKQRHDAAELAKAYAELDKAIEANNTRIGDTRKNGMTQLADDMEKATVKIREAIDKVTLSLADSQKDWQSAMEQSLNADGFNIQPITEFFDTVWGRAALEWGKSTGKVSETLVTNLSEGILTAADQIELGGFMDEFYKSFTPTPQDITAIENSMTPIYDLLANPKIDQSKVWAEIDSIIAKNMSDGHLNLQGVVNDINAFATASTTAAGSVELMAKPFAGMTKEAQEWAYMLDDLRLKGNEVAANQIQNMDQYFNAIVTTSGDQANQAAAAQDRLNAAIANGSVDVHAIATNFAYYKSLLDQGLISQDTYNYVISNTVANMSDFASATDDAAAAQARLAKQLDDNKKYAKATGDAIAEIFRMDTGEYPLKRQLEELFPNREKTRSALTAAIDAGDTAEVVRLTDALRDQNDQWESLYDSFIKAGPALREALGMLSGADLGHAGANNAMDSTAKLAEELLEKDEQRKAMAEGVTAAIKQQQEAYQGMFESFASYQGLDSRTLAYGMTSFAGEAAKAGIAMQGVQAGLSNTFRIIVDNTNGVSELANKTLEWAEGLVGAEGTAGKIDDLLARGLINQQQYTDAQTAYNSIAADTAKIQDYTLQIQAKQAPLIAQQTDALEKQYGIIAGMEGQTQLAALGWMDSAEAAKALEINAMAADVAAGKMGASGKKGFEDMLQAAVLMDPALGAMLDQMGLIELAADGTTILSIDYGQAKGAESEIAKLTESINALILALGGIPPLNVDTVGLMTAEQRVKALQVAWDALTKEERQTFFDKLGQGAEASSGKLQKTAEDVKRVNDAITAIGQGKTVDIDTTSAQHNLESIADHFKQLDGKTVKADVDIESDTAVDAMKQLSDNLTGLDGKTVSLRTRFDQSGKDDALGAIQNLETFDGRVITISTKFQTEGAAPDMGKYDQGGKGGAVSAIEVPLKYGALPPLDLPKPPPVIVPIQFSMATAGGIGPTGVPGGMESALGGAAGGGGITIAVTVTVTGTEQLDAIKKTIDGLANKPVSVSVAVSGAELIGALKLDVQNLSNKTLTIMVSVSGAEAISTLKTQVGELSSKAFTITSDNTDALTDIQAVLNLLAQITSKAFSISSDNSDAIADSQAVIDNMAKITSKAFSITSDNTDALTDIQAVVNLLAQITSKAFSITSDATDATTDIDTVKAGLDGIAAKTVVITGDATIAFAAIDNVNGATVADKTLVIFGDATIALAALDNVNGTDVPSKTLVIDGDASGALGAIGSVASALASMPSSKTVTVNVVTSGSVPALAKGGYVPGLGPNAVMARMGELGPELFRKPGGKYGLVSGDGLYPMEPGSYVYNHRRTRQMLRNWRGPAFARGGRVQRPNSPTRAALSARGSSSINAPVSVNATVYTQGRMDDGEKRQFVQEIATSLRDGVNIVHMGKGGRP